MSATIRYTRLTRSFGAALCLSTMLSACEGETTGIGDVPVEGEVTIDASNPTAFSYFTFADGGSIVSVSDPSSSTEWDMAFRRFTVKLNGGVSGPGAVSGVNLENNASLDSAAVLALTPADAESAFAAVTEDDIAGTTFAEDGLVADPSAWLSFGQMGPVANPTEAWKVRLADGEHGVMRAVGLALGPSVTATFEVRHQASGGSLGAIDSVTVDISAAAAFIDLETGSAVTPAGCNWDVQVMPLSGDLDVTVNDACSAGTFPLDVSEDFSAITAADDAPEYGAFLAVTAGAFPASFSGPEGVFWYNLDGSMRLFPTQNVFLVRVGTAVYKLQITDYYNQTGDSGFPTVRFEQIQ
jgi:hypothetical protein